jgi:dTDP-4-amino-4,6-dideoxygalactose transaminase
LAIKAVSPSEKTEVIVPDFTFPATANVVIDARQRPVLADVTEDTYSLKVSEVSRGAGKQTSAVMPVHPFGNPFEMDEVYELASKRGLEVIEDAATATGTKYRGRMVGSRGRAVCFSFHPRKLLTTAEGGCLVTDDAEVDAKARALRNHGQVTADGKTKFLYNGLNYRMSDVHAAIGLAQLGRLEMMIERRRRQARLYDELLGDEQLDARPQTAERHAYHSYQSYVIVLGNSFPDRDRSITLMRERFGVEVQLGTYSLASQAAFRGVKKIGALRASRRVYGRSLTLPLYDSLTEEQQAYVVRSLSSLAQA